MDRFYSREMGRNNVGLSTCLLPTQGPVVGIRVDFIGYDYICDTYDIVFVLESSRPLSGFPAVGW